MPTRPPLYRRLATAATWPIGIALTSWDYMWRITPLHRREEEGSLPEDAPPPLTEAISRAELQPLEEGVGPLFHRSYRIRIRNACVDPEELLEAICSDLNRVAPTKFARFFKVHGLEGTMRVGDEYVVRMPGPWDGPVRVVAKSARSFRLATLAGHLEAGQIEFKARIDDGLVFQIESWARSGDRLSDLLYHRLRMAKEIQLHMWTSFLEQIATLAGGRLSSGIEIVTRRIENSDERDD